MSKPSSHQVNVVQLSEPRVHANADTLELFDIGGYQVVTKKGQFKAGDLAVYIQPDSVVPQTPTFAFLWAEYLARPNKCQHRLSDGSCTIAFGLDQPVCHLCAAHIVNGETALPEEKRRVTVRRFRKEWSEGLLLPVSEFPEVAFGLATSVEDETGNVRPLEPSIQVGDDVSDLIGVTHYEGDSVENTDGSNESKPHRKYPRTVKGWFYWTLFKLGFRGARKNLYEETAYDISKFDVESYQNFKHAIVPGEQVIVTEKVHGSQARYFFKEGKMYAGSRNFWKAENSPCVWRKALRDCPWIEEWCRANEGAVLYGEVVPTQKGFQYGVEPGKANFFQFDIKGADGVYFPKEQTLSMLNPVPVIYAGEWNESVLTTAEGKSWIDERHMREGVVVTVRDPGRHARGLGRIQLKIKSRAFLEKEGNR
jgi:RNA ligase